MVGDYVPFYFCPRSIMLYILHMANHPDLTYHGGQSPIVHLMADLEAVVEWATAAGRRWAFSHGNAGTKYCSFRSRLEDLSELDWNAIKATDFRDPMVKERKQAEFLLHTSFPWQLVEKIGVLNASVKNRVITNLQYARHKPLVSIEQDWYY